MINDQITKELYSSTLYLSMSAWFSAQNLDGFAQWYYVQTAEERDHALILYQYLLKTGGDPVLQALEKPDRDFADIADVLARTVKHEEFITSSIYEIVKAANEEMDYKTVQFLNWFVDEQVQEEDTANKNLNRFKTMGSEGKGLFMLDSQMGARVYTKTALLTTMETK